MKLNTKRTVLIGFAFLSICAVACMDQNDFDPKTGSAPFRTVFETEHMEEKPAFHHYSVACMHCDNAPCITACPVQCLRKDPETNLTVYDNTRCIGCHSCAMACPFGAPSFNAQGKMEKCNGCYVRLQYGLQPACVRVCPTGALRMVTEEEYNATHTAGSIITAAREIVEGQI